MGQLVRFAWAAVFLAGCGGDDEPGRADAGADAEVADAGPDAPPVDAPPIGCDVDGDCDDGIVCTVDRCNLAARECRCLGPDEDDDGHADAECAGADGVPVGDDCDDGNPNRYPGFAERCDTIDQDCDGSTVGNLDED